MSRLTLAHFPMQPFHVLRQLRQELLLWRRRAEERAALARMTEIERHDIGITRTDVWLEIEKPCWRK
jgi:uncharacterized protein YjiS (DUF1127 family)